MIRLSDALILAGTKLRTHRVRTTVTIVLSSLLFAALIAAVIMAQGVTKSITVFDNEGLNNRYIVWARADSPFVGNVLGSSSVIALVKQKGKDLIVAKQAEAKKLGIDYNVNNEVPATITQTSPGYSPTEHINMQSYAVTEALQEYVKQHPSSSLDDLKKAAAIYHPIGFYTSINSASEGGDIKIMPSGSENFNPTDDQRASLEFSRNEPLVIDDYQLTKPFVYQDVAVKKGDIPLVVSYSTAENWLGLPQLSSNASAKQHYDRIQQLYKQTTGGDLTIATCYRNSVSQSQIDQAISQADEIAKNVNNKDYQKPNLIYGLPPANSCAQAPIISDTRTDAEKKTQAAQDQFNSDFGQIVTPVQQKLTFQVIGLSPSESNDSNTTFSSLLASIVGSSLTNGANVIPNSLLDQVPNAAVIKSILLPITGSPLGIASPDYYVEFSNATNARAFIADKSCTTRSDGTCASPGRLFQLIASGNNSIALQDLQQKIASVLAIATLAVVVLAIIIMTTMVGRTVADGRRETAVFRALGAKRSDIGLIYTIYTLCLTLIIAVISLAIGVGVAYGFNTYYGQDATLQAKLLFDAVNANLNFSFFGINITILGAIVTVVLITGLISMVIPLLRNIRRNPIKDMREE